MAKSFIKYSYDVFLSFRGEDTRYNFTGNLYYALRKRGINTFLDDQNLRIGDEISPSLLEAIEESRISIIVFSENYASSTWCLDELMKILNCMKQNKELVWPIFYKVDPSDLRHQRNSYGQAMATHEIRFGKDSQKVLNWRYALTKVANLKGDHFRIGYEYESKFIDKIVKKVSDKLPFKGLHIEEHVVGLDSHIEEAISLLDIPSYNMVCMLGIHGIGGIGKTTLVKALYNSIIHQFEYATFLFDVRETSNQYKGLISLQETLLSKIFEIEDVKLSSVDEGAFVIKNRFCNKRVLLVFDDVDSKEQLEKLVGKCDWFGSGSRIILTTRDKHLLLAHGIEKTYEMKKLNNHEASKLFCWKAFNSSHPPERFVDLSNEVVNYASGLPLALKVIGSDLFGKDLDECECALNQYKRIPNKNIQGILRISYDGLENNQKEIFLDIACFFKGYSLEDVKNTLNACDFGPKYHIGVLVDKSLVTIDKSGYVQMHDLIQDMGREVVREAAPKEPEKRSRLWFNEDIIRVLKENSGTSNIEGIILKSCQQEIQWSGNAFKKMKNLRILIIQNTHFSIGPKYLPDNLRFLDWKGYPSTSLPPNFDPRRLIVLKMPHSCLKLEKSFKKFEYVSVMDFSYCQFIIEVPDMSGVPALRELTFSGCENLVKIHDSVGFLSKVSNLSLRSCTNLTSLPSGIQMKSLERLDIHGCRSLERFPEILGNMDCLLVIDASSTAIKELPNSIGNLTRLTELYLWKSNLFSIPECIKKLSNLKILLVSDSKKLRKISEISSSLKGMYAENCTSLTLHSSNVLWSQAIREVSNMDIIMPGEQVPDWFDHRCEGNALSFWVRNKFPVAAFAFIAKLHSKYIEGENKTMPVVRLQLSMNGVELNQRYLSIYYAHDQCHAYLRDLRTLIRGEEWKDLDKYLVHEWNHVEVKVIEKSKMSLDIAINECGVFLYKQESNMEDVRFECPNSTMSAVTVPGSVLKRGATFNLGYEPPKKLMRNHKPRGIKGKFHSPGQGKAKRRE